MLCEKIKDNFMYIYKKVSKTPKEARKTITGGRLDGFTDINPMWRIEKLTETFGPCGIGWWDVITGERIEEGSDGNKKAFVDIDLFYKVGEIVSQPIPGVGGSSFVAKERNGLYTSDECFKMALTDAIGVACKALGFSADIYYGEGYDISKYTKGNEERDAFEERVTSEEAKSIVKAAKEKWKENAAERISPILEKYHADSTVSLLRIYLDDVLKEIGQA